MKFAIGERVVRHENVFDRGSRLLHGKVVEVYEWRTRNGYYPELYAVLWDDRTEPSKGFLPHGLTKEPTNAE